MSSFSVVHDKLTQIDQVTSNHLSSKLYLKENAYCYHSVIVISFCLTSFGVAQKQ